MARNKKKSQLPVVTNYLFTNWQNKPFLHPNYEGKVKFKGFTFPSIAKALLFASIKPDYSYAKGAMDNLAKDIIKCPVDQIDKFRSLPTVNDWYDKRLRKTLHQLYGQRFRDRDIRKKFARIKPSPVFAFDQSISGFPFDKVSGCVVKDDRIIGSNIVGSVIQEYYDMFTSGLVVLITGGRNYEDEHCVNKTLDSLHKAYNITLLVHGGADGADKLSGKWAKRRKVKQKVFDAKWKDIHVLPCLIRHNRYGKYNALAGLNRNSDMGRFIRRINASKDKNRGITVAFPGGTGTRDMIVKSLKYDIPTFLQLDDLMKIAGVEGPSSYKMENVFISPDKPLF